MHLTGRRVQVDGHGRLTGSSPESADVRHQRLGDRVVVVEPHRQVCGSVQRLRRKGVLLFMWNLVCGNTVSTSWGCFVAYGQPLRPALSRWMKAKN